MTIISIFCKVIDNFGDIGVCWRLARNFCTYLDEKNQIYTINLYVDNIEALNNITQNNYYIKNINVLVWQTDNIFYDNADYVINAFACKPPYTYQENMPKGIIWVQLDYLATEEWADEYHGLHAFINQHKRIFFTSGFTHKTAGIIKNDMNRINAKNKIHLYSNYGVKKENNQINLLFFSYINQQFISALNSLIKLQNSCKLENPYKFNIYMPQGVYDKFKNYISDNNIIDNYNINVLKFCSQQKFDELLQLFDIIWVRGEDSFIRAQLTQIPMIWQAYLQENNAHVDKIDGFLKNYLNFFDDNHQEILKNLWYAANSKINFTKDIWQHFIDIIDNENYNKGLENWRKYLDNLPNLADEIIKLKEKYN